MKHEADDASQLLGPEPYFIDSTAEVFESVIPAIQDKAYFLIKQSENRLSDRTMLDDAKVSVEEERKAGNDLVALVFFTCMVQELSGT